MCDLAPPFFFFLVFPRSSSDMPEEGLCWQWNVTFTKTCTPEKSGVEKQMLWYQNTPNLSVEQVTDKSYQHHRQSWVKRSLKICCLGLWVSFPVATFQWRGKKIRCWRHKKADPPCCGSTVQVVMLSVWDVIKQCSNWCLYMSHLMLPRPTRLFGV